jgi:hypothetical protein
VRPALAAAFLAAADRRIVQMCHLVDAHRDGKRFVVRADEKLTAFLELEAAIRAAICDGQLMPNNDAARVQ